MWKIVFRKGCQVSNSLERIDEELVIRNSHGYSTTVSMPKRNHTQRHVIGLPFYNSLKPDLGALLSKSKPLPKPNEEIRRQVAVMFLSNACQKPEFLETYCDLKGKKHSIPGENWIVVRKRYELGFPLPGIITEFQYSPP